MGHPLFKCFKIGQQRAMQCSFVMRYRISVAPDIRVIFATESVLSKSPL